MGQNRMKQNVYKMLFTVGIGGIFSCYLLELSRIKLLPLSEQLQRSIALGNIPEIHISSLEIMISFISVLQSYQLHFLWTEERKQGKGVLYSCAFYLLTSVVWYLQLSGGNFFIYILWLYGFLLFTLYGCVLKF